MATPPPPLLPWELGFPPRPFAAVRHSASGEAPPPDATVREEVSRGGQGLLVEWEEEVEGPSEEVVFEFC